MQCEAVLTIDRAFRCMGESRVCIITSCIIAAFKYIQKCEVGVQNYVIFIICEFEFLKNQTVLSNVRDLTSKFVYMLINLKQTLV